MNKAAKKNNNKENKDTKENAKRVKDTKDTKADKKKGKERSKSNAKEEKAPRARSAYILFGIDERPKVVKDNPEMAPKDIMKELGVRWGDASEDAKAKYKAMSEKEKAKILSDKEADSNEEKTANVKGKPKSKK